MNDDLPPLTLPLPDESPTLMIMCQAAAKVNTPCVSLVRKPLDGKPPCIMVVMQGAKRKPFSRALHEIGRKLPKNPEQVHKLEFDFHTGLEKVFQWLEESGEHSFNGQTLIGPVTVEFVGFIGAETCERVALALSELGCPTSLTA